MEGALTMGKPVITIQEFLAKYGTHTPGLMVETFIKQAPPFDGEVKLAMALGELMADLQSTLITESRKAK